MTEICIIGVILCTGISITRFSLGWMVLWMALAFGFMALGVAST